MKNVGIVCSKNNENYELRKYYVEMFNYFGIQCVLLPVGSDYSFFDLKIDGLVLPGGGDIHSALFGQEVIPQIRNVDLERDLSEINLCRHAVCCGIGVLGICRGMQVINVAFGGDLIQHLPPKKLLLHEENNHSVLITDEHFVKIVGCKSFTVNSYHHQAVNVIAEDLLPLCYSQDGVLEAFCCKNKKNILGLQFHPERIYRNSLPVENIIKDFCENL